MVADFSLLCFQCAVVGTHEGASHRINIFALPTTASRLPPIIIHSLKESEMVAGFSFARFQCAVGGTHEGTSHRSSIPAASTTASPAQRPRPFPRPG